MSKATKNSIHTAIFNRHGLRIPATGVTIADGGCRSDYAIAVSDSKREVYEIRFPTAQRADRIIWWQELLAHLDTKPDLKPDPYSRERYRNYAR